MYLAKTTIFRYAWLLPCGNPGHGGGLREKKSLSVKNTTADLKV